MRTLAIALFTFALLSLPLGSTVAQKAPLDVSYPGDFAVQQVSSGKWRIRAFPSLLPIYVFDGDSPGKSFCNLGCIGPWTPIRAADTAKPIGAWTIIKRDDGRRQWAYKGRPVYTHFNDFPDKPTGDGEEGKWHLLEL